MLAILTSHPIQYQAPLWRELAAAGVRFEVWFLTPHAVAESWDREFGTSFAWDVDLLSGYSYRFLPILPNWRMDRFFGVRVIPSWRQLFKNAGVTHVWIEGWRFHELWAAVYSAHRLGIPVFLRGENHNLNPKPRFRGFFRRIALLQFFSRVSAFLSIGEANREFYLSFGVREASIHRAPYCIDNDRFFSERDRLRPMRPTLRAQFGIPDNAAVILFCGKLISKKRPLDVVAAARHLKQQGLNVYVLFAGDGDLRPKVKDAMLVGKIAGLITGFLNQSEIPRVFAVADCLVLPSDYGETWGLVVNEAMASGVPTVISDRCGSAHDLGTAQGRHHIFECSDITALSNAVHQVLVRPPTLERLSEIIRGYAPRQTVQTVQRLLAEK